MADYSRDGGYYSSTATWPVQRSELEALEKRIKTLEGLTTTPPTAKIKGDLLKRIEELEAENATLRSRLDKLKEAFDD